MAVKNMLVLRWNQRAHYWFLGRPKGHIRAPKGTVPFGNGLARTLVCISLFLDNWNVRGMIESESRQQMEPLKAALASRQVSVVAVCFLANESSINAETMLDARP